MPAVRTVPAWAVAVVAMCCGCRQDPSIGTQAFLLAIAELDCRERSVCARGDDDTFFDLDRCIADRSPALMSFAKAMLRPDHTEFNPAAALACLQWIEARRWRCTGAADVWNWQQFGPPCGAVFRGLGKGGSVCQSKWDCQSASCGQADPCAPWQCLSAVGDGQPCPDSGGNCGLGRVCGSDDRCWPYAEPAIGQPCHWATACGPDAECSPEGVCRAIAGVNQLCGQSATAGKTQCPAKLACVRAGAGLSNAGQDVCKPGRATLGSCSEKFPCAAGLTCSGGHCGVPAENGVECTKHTPCTGLDRACQPDSSGVRHCLPLPDDGEPCLASKNAPAADRRCQRGLYCDPASQKCRSQTGKQQPCAGQDECGSPLACWNGACVGDATLGEPCSPDDAWSCKGNGWCKNGVCAAPAALGQDCTDTFGACDASGYCDNGKCALRKGIGEPCSDFNQCMAPLQCDLISCQPSPCGHP